MYACERDQEVNEGERLPQVTMVYSRDKNQQKEITHKRVSLSYSTFKIILINYTINIKINWEKTFSLTRPEKSKRKKLG